MFPERPSAKQFANSPVDVYPMQIGGNGPGLPMQVRLYLPPGHHDPKTLPCVFIAPAGTRLVHGSALDDNDSAEHLPYAAAGFAVLAYELSGDVPDSDSGPMTFARLAVPMQQFIAADGGMANARAAIEFVLKKVPEVDPARLYAAGHSSAAVVALDLAVADSRIKGVCAYAPACDIDARMDDALPQMERVAPGVTALAAKASPIRHAAEIRCPVLLFHADDDTNVPTSDNQSYADALRAAGKSIDFVRVQQGGHYQSMISQGIPAGIAWLVKHGAAPRPK